MVAIVDYGVGNLYSLKCSFAAIGQEACVTGDFGALLRADRIVLPGVGAFGDAAEKLKEKGLDGELKRLSSQGKPLLGICLGMQLLFDKSYEYGEHEGLGLIRGAIRPIAESLAPDTALKIPHIGWNPLNIVRSSPLFKYVKPRDCVYFVHSYHACDCAPSVIATAEYGATITAAVERDNVFGCQFHPEKSGGVGLNILRAFCELRG